MFRSRKLLGLILIVIAECLAYSNHFHNGFHFDDSHSVVENPFIRSLHNLPQIFTDTTAFSVLPANRTYRPFVTASLAVDYALGHGYAPFWFQLSTFLVFLAQLGVMLWLFSSLLRRIRPEQSRSNDWIALLAVAWYGLHPAMAETVNYVIQRGDVYCAFGVVAAMAIYVGWPQKRRYGVYLLPFSFALLSKPPASVFPLLLVVYVVLFEPEGLRSKQRKQTFVTLACCILTCAALMGLQAHMTPKSYTPSTLPASAYILTQPFVLMRYFGAFFLPLHLNVDTDLLAFRSLNTSMLLGFAFVIALLIAIRFTAKHKISKPIAFGLSWFLITSLPTSLYRLSEVENDHRMFLPFVGLTIAVSWSVWIGVERLCKGHTRKVLQSVLAAAVVLLLAADGYGVWQRNQVWSSDESLWKDDVLKCPRNGRGWMNYGLTLMARGAYPEALAAFQQALIFTPNYPTLEINLGVVLGELQQQSNAEQHFIRAVQLAPASDQPHFFYARWLAQQGRIEQALLQAQQAVALNNSHIAQHDLLAQMYAAVGDLDKARAIAAESLQLDAGDQLAQHLLMQPAIEGSNLWIDLSMKYYRIGDYPQCIATARQALKVLPAQPLAYNNIGAAFAGMKRWDEAIESEETALRLKPDFQIARNNLENYRRQRTNPAVMAVAKTTPDEWLNSSLSAYRMGEFQQSIRDAQQALRLRPDYAEAYNNIAASYASLHQWDAAIKAANEAIRLKPDFTLAKNNLAWAISEKQKGSR